MQKRIKKSPLHRVKDVLDDIYILDDVINESGTGIVYKGHRKKDINLIIVIKFYILSYPLDFVTQTWLNAFGSKFMYIDNEVFDAEFNFLKRIRHPGLQELVSFGKLEEASKYFPPAENYYLPKDDVVKYIVTKYIEGDSIDKWIEEKIKGNLYDDKCGTSDHTKSRKNDVRDIIINSIVRIADILCFIHETKQYQHSDLSVENILIHKDSGQPILIDFGFDHCFDLDALGIDSKTTHIKYFSRAMPNELEEELRKYIEETDSNVIDREKLKSMTFPALDLFQYGRILQSLIAIPGIDHFLTDFDLEFLGSLISTLSNWQVLKHYRTSIVRNQLLKITEGYWSGVGLNTLQTRRESNRIIQLPGKTLYISDKVESILKTNGFRRLQLLNQLSLLNLVYPGANQTRLEHALSVYANTNELISALLKSPRFCLLFDKKAVAQFSIISLLHDINHFPFLHYFQEFDIPSLKKVDIVGYFCDGQATKDNPSILEIISDLDIGLEFIKDVLLKDHEAIEDPVRQVIKSIVDSGLDIDKISYVLDDAISTGVPFGRGVDRQMLFKSADIVKLKKNSYHLFFHSEALSAVESLLMARYWNFKQVYWHHTNRAIVAMIGQVINRIYREKDASFEEYLSDTDGSTEAEAISYLNNKYRSLFQSDSIIMNLVDRRDKIFKRIYSLRRQFEWKPLDQPVINTKLFDGLYSLEYNEKRIFLEGFRKNLQTHFSRELDGMEIADGHLLLDIPGRDLGREVGDLYVGEIDSDGSFKIRISSPILDDIIRIFSNITNTIRIFLHPDIRDKICKNTVNSRREEIEELVRQALDRVESGKKSQIRRGQYEQRL